MKGPGGNEADSIDGGVLRSVAGTLGASRLAALLVIFEARIGWLEASLDALPNDLSTLLFALHQSRGSAASLGFERLNEVLAEIEHRLRPESAHVGHRPPLIVTKGINGRGLSKRALSKPKDALGVVWQASLAAAEVHVPELRHHRPFGRSK